MILGNSVTGGSRSDEFLHVIFIIAKPNAETRSNKNDDRTVTEARSPHAKLGLWFLSCSRSFVSVRTIKFDLYDVSIF